MSAKREWPVVFVGAGPGDPELVTVKGKRVIESADLILYAGSLVQDQVMAWARHDAEMLDTASLDLEAIVEAMASGHAAGKRVARVHSGDPSLYGAIREQIAELDARGVPWEVVPGVTAAFAAAALEGIEFTVPEKTQTLILTRAAGRTPVPEQEAVERLASHGASMVIYLSVKMIRSLARSLAESYGDDAPVMVAYRVGWPEQAVIKGTLAEIADLVEEAGIERQAVVIVGPCLDKHCGGKSRLYDRGFSHMFRAGRCD